MLRCLSIVCDYLKWSTHSFGQQLLVEIAAGISFALAVLVLQVGLLIALVRYRLYDAEFVISQLGERRADHAGGGCRVRRHGGWPQADHLQLLWQHQQRRADHLCRGPFDGAGQPDPGARSALVRAPLSERISSCCATICPRLRATCARPLRLARCSMKSSPASTAACARCGARRSSTAACCVRAGLVDRRGRGMAHHPIRAGL